MDTENNASASAENVMPDQPAAAPAPAPTPTPTPTPAAGTVPEYDSNPLSLVKPSLTALGLNFWRLVGAIFYSMLVGILGVALPVLFGYLLAKALPGWLAVVLGLVAFLASLYWVIRHVAAFVPLLVFESAKGNKVTFKDTLRRSQPFALTILGVGIMAGAATLGGYIFLIIPGLLFGAWFSLAGLAVLDENRHVAGALGRSLQLAEGHVVELIGLVWLASVPSTILGVVPIQNALWGLLVFLATLIPFLVMLPALALRYFQLKKAPAKQKTHWVNYLVIAVMVIGTPIGFVTKAIHDAKKHPAVQTETSFPSSSDYTY